MTALEFNATHKVGDAVVHDPAPLLGEPAETCTVLEEAFDQIDDSDSANILWSAVPLRRPNGDKILVRLDHLAI
jgi:hypothetical protein